MAIIESALIGQIHTFGVIGDIEVSKFVESKKIEIDWISECINVTF